MLRFLRDLHPTTTSFTPLSVIEEQLEASREASLGQSSGRRDNSWSVIFLHLLRDKTTSSSLFFKPSAIPELVSNLHSLVWVR